MSHRDVLGAPLGSLAAGLTALGLAACGGHAATRGEVIARGNAICATATRAIRAIPAPVTASETSAGPRLARIARAVQAQVDGLRDLPRPVARRGQLDRFLAAEAGVAASYRRIAAAARAGDTTGVQRGLQALAGSDAPRLAARYGLTQCTGAIATVR